MKTLITFKSRSIPLLILMAVCSQGFADETVHVVLLAGQSNMAGAGSFNDLSSAEKQRIQSVSKRVLLSDNGKPAAPLTFRIAKGHLEKYGYQEAFGPEMFIGVTLAEANPDRSYLLVKFSRGGTSLYGAWNPDWSANKAKEVEKGVSKQTKKLFQLHIEAIRSQLDQLTRQGKTYQIIGMAWMQGENDAAKEVSAVSYQANLNNLIAAYRREFKVPKMPFVCGQINSRYGDFPNGPAIVRAAFVSVADADRNVAVIETSTEQPATDFPKVDGVHYNAEGQKRLGTAMARSLLSLQPDTAETPRTHQPKKSR